VTKLTRVSGLLQLPFKIILAILLGSW